MAKDNQLIIPVGQEEDILQYQIEMLHYNPQPGILPVQTRFSNQDISLCYNLGFRLPVSERLQHQSITSEEVLQFLLKLVDILQDSMNIFLNPASFILELPYLYVDPHTWDVALIYLPLKPRLDLQQSLINLIEKLQLTEPHLSSNSKEVQEIRKYLQQDFVSLLQFKNFLIQVRLQSSLLSEVRKEKPFRLVKQKKQLGEKREKDKNRLGENKEKKENIQKISLRRKGIFSFILVQILIAILLVSGSGFLDSLGDPIPTYLGLALLLGGINVLVLRKLFSSV